VAGARALCTCAERTQTPALAYGAWHAAWTLFVLVLAFAATTRQRAWQATGCAADVRVRRQAAVGGGVARASEHSCLPFSCATYLLTLRHFLYAVRSRRLQAALGRVGRDDWEPRAGGYLPPSSGGTFKALTPTLRLLTARA